ncbi:transcriptional regulator [Streptomyces sp. NPDC020412]|uniref:transcriptional regulator n=1 Tax=Streptomyces sp. NPDC020412 TaxID=3365073 RepID=UPI0037A12F6E
MSPTADDARRGASSAPGTGGAHEVQAVAAADFETDTRSLRAQYWTTEPAELIGPVTDHAAEGGALLAKAEGEGERAGEARRALANALAETRLIAGRIRYHGLKDREGAELSFRQARQAADAAGNPLLGAAALGHLALLADASDDAGADVLAEARALAGRGAPIGRVTAWLDAVEAERAAGAGENQRALRLISDAETSLAAAGSDAQDWLDWCTPSGLGVLKGLVQLQAGLTSQARRTLLYSMAPLAPDEHAQRSLVYLGLAAVEAAEGEEYEACGYACRSLEHIEACGDVLGVRAALDPYLHESCVADLYENLFPST